MGRLADCPEAEVRHFAAPSVRGPAFAAVPLAFTGRREIGDRLYSRSVDASQRNREDPDSQRLSDHPAR